MDFNEIPSLISSIQTRLTTLESQVAALESAAQIQSAAPPASGADADAQAQLAEECASLRRQLEDACSVRGRLEEEIRDLRQQTEERDDGEASLAALQNRVLQLERELVESAEECRKANEAWQQNYQAYQEANQAEQKANGELETLRKEKDAADQKARDAEMELEELRKGTELAGEKARAAEAELAGAQAVQASLQRELDSYRESEANTAAMLERFWPSCLNAAVLQQFHEQWRAELGRKDASPTLLCMFANIFSWSCFHELLKSKEQTDNDLERSAYTALHTFSRHFLDWLYETGKSNDEAASISRELATHINGQLSADNAKYAIEVDEVDLQDTFSSALMQAVPQGNSTGHVKRLHSWAIIHSANRGICLLKAMVLL